MSLLNHLKRQVARPGTRHCLRYSSSASNDSEYQTVPFYEQKSALYIRPSIPSERHQFATAYKNLVFPRLISPELVMGRLLGCTWLEDSLSARHIHLNLEHLRQDYAKMSELKKELDVLQVKADEISNQVRMLIKSNAVKQGKDREEVLNTPEMKELVSRGQDIKAEISRISEQFLPLEEIVMIACLRLPNELHFSTLQNNLQYFRAFSAPAKLSVLDVRSLLFSYNTSLCESKAELFGDGSGVTVHHIATESEIAGSHTAFATLQDSLLDKQPSINEDLAGVSVYHSGIYASIEQALVDYTHEKLANFPLEHVKSVSMFKSCVVEGCGLNFNDPRDIFNVVRFNVPEFEPEMAKSDKQKSKMKTKGTDEFSFNIELLHLMGAGSLNSLILNFIRTQTNRKYLPWTVYSNGKVYAPASGQVNMFTMLSLFEKPSQFLFSSETETNVARYSAEKLERATYRGIDYLTCITHELEQFSSDPSTHSLFNSADIDESLIDTLKLFLYVYGPLKVPIKFVCANTSDLEENESLKIEVEGYLPSDDRFVKVGEVSLLGEYVSKRLQIRIAPEDANQPPKHPSMIFTKLMNVNLVTQILIEANSRFNTQENQVTFQLPDALHDRYFVKQQS